MKLTLDLNKWRCGGDNGPYKWGDGETCLLNDNNKMCCLGQFGLQCGLRRREIYRKTTFDCVIIPERKVSEALNLFAEKSADFPEEFMDSNYLTN